MLNPHIFGIFLCVVLITQIIGQYTHNNQKFLEKYFPGKIHFEGRRFDSSSLPFQHEVGIRQDSWVGIPSLLLRPYELVESTTTRPPPTTTRPSTTTTRSTTKPTTTTTRPTTTIVRRTRSTPATTRTRPTTTREPWRPPTTTTTTPRQRASLDLDSVLDSKWNFIPNEWTPKTRSYTTRTPITVVAATTQLPMTMTRYASNYKSNKIGLKKIKMKKKQTMTKQMIEATATPIPRQSPYKGNSNNGVHNYNYNQGQYFLRITPPTRRPVKTAAKKKNKKVKKKEAPKKTSSGSSPSQPEQTFLNQYTAVTLAPGVDPQNPIVQHLIAAYGDKNPAGTKKTRTPKRMEEDRLQDTAERTLLFIGLMLTWSFWIVVFITGLKQHYVVPPDNQEVHVHHVHHPPNRALNVDRSDNNDRSDWTMILKTIKLAGEVYDEFNELSKDVNVGIMSKIEAEKKSGHTENRIKRKSR